MSVSSMGKAGQVVTGARPGGAHGFSGVWSLCFQRASLHFCFQLICRFPLFPLGWFSVCPQGFSASISGCEGPFKSTHYPTCGTLWLTSLYSGKGSGNSICDTVCHALVWGCTWSSVFSYSILSLPCMTYPGP